MRRRRNNKAVGVNAPPEPIHPTALYRRREAAAVLRLTDHQLREEVEMGRLTCRWHGRRQAFLGEELLAWARQPRPRPEPKGG
jgi:hypothetical protein